MTKPSRHRRQAEVTGITQRKIQAQLEAKESPGKSSGNRSKPEKPATRARAKPKSPQPEQHQDKPGNESELDPRPRFIAPDYRGSGKLDGMVALITGGDSGIGRAVAVLFAREGADVAIVYLCEHEDARTTCQHVEKEGRRCLSIAGDVSDPAFCGESVGKVLEKFGKLDVLVNNAAFQQHARRIEDITAEQFDETLKTNAYGYFHMAKAAIPHLGPGSSIINTGSETGLFGSGGLLDYSMTKGAIHALTKSLASHLGDRGIRVNAVAPGPVWTPLNPADQSAEDVATFGKDNLMGRPAQPEELSPAYVFLAAPACSSYINGAVLPVMGGPTG